jgi:ABC-2 type transport system permease protein
MTADAPLAHPVGPVRGVPALAALLGLGSVFGKTLRDSRVAIVIVAALLGVMILAGGGVMANTYGTLEARAELGLMSRDMPPLLRGFYGNPLNVDRLGGFISWHYAAYFAMLAGLWSILALSSTIAGEARRGNLDLTAATPHARRVIAVQKVSGHLAGLVVAMAILGVLAWLTGLLFGTLPGDEVEPGAAAAFAIRLGVRALIAGSVAFALAPLLGRGASAGIAGALMVAGYVTYGYRTVVPAFDQVASFTWWSWTADHIPLAGSYDWAGIAVTGIVAIVLLGIGIEGFARRDIGVTVALPTPAPPATLLGIRGPLGRSFGDTLPGAFWWAVGLGIYGVAMATASRSMIDLLEGSPEMATIFRTLIPGIDLTTAAGFLQLAFADLGFVLVGLAVTMLVGGRWSDEREGRLELHLTTPLTRPGWAVVSGLAVALGVALITVVLGGAIGVGVAAIGQDPVTPMTGTLVLGLYGLALAGIGMAAGGIAGPDAAARVVAAIVIGTFLLDMLAPMLRLPDWVAQLALTTHLGEPMIGSWDLTGVVACVALAVLGLAVGAWGMSRRDIAR